MHYARILYMHILTHRTTAYINITIYPHTSNIIVAVIEDSVREEQFLHDMCLLGAVRVEITQILTRAGYTLIQVHLNPS